MASRILSFDQAAAWSSRRRSRQDPDLLVQESLLAASVWQHESGSGAAAAPTDGDVLNPVAGGHAAAPPLGDIAAGLPQRPAERRPRTEAAPAASETVGWQLVTTGSGTPRLWRFVTSGQSAAIDDSLETLVLIHGWLGSGVTTPPSSPSGFTPALSSLAAQQAGVSRQVLFLDWGEQAMDPNPSGLAPYNAAGRINAVAGWAREPLQTLANSGRTLTLVGFSLGSYVAAQTASALGSGSNLRLVALDPAAAGLQGSYDLDRSNATADPVPNLASTAPGGSLAFVVADSNLSIGIAGDNARAATAQRSFLVRGFSSGTAAGVAHGAVPALYADLCRYLSPNAAITDTILAGFRNNQYSNSGSRSGTLLHEGLASVRSNQGGIARLEGFTSGGAAQTVLFVDAIDSATPAGSSTSQDTIVALRNVQLASGASIERLVLGGGDALAAGGNAGIQELIGNAADNRLEAGGALDRLTGGDGRDTFVYTTLSDGLIGGSSSQRSFERITDLVTGMDTIDAPGSATRSISLLGAVTALSDAGLTALLTPARFAAGAAAVFASGSSPGDRRFLGLNDGTAGFDPLRDAILEITGLQGDPLALMVS